MTDWSVEKKKYALADTPFPSPPWPRIPLSPSSDVRGLALLAFATVAKDGDREGLLETYVQFWAKYAANLDGLTNPRERKTAANAALDAIHGSIDDAVLIRLLATQVDRSLGLSCYEILSTGADVKSVASTLMLNGSLRHYILGTSYG